MSRSRPTGPSSHTPPGCSSRPVNRSADRAARTSPGCNDQRMSMAGMGLMGLVAGASTAGMMGVVRLMGDTWLPRLAANSQHKHEMIATLQEHRHETVQHWRSGLASARDTYRQWEAGTHDHDAPNAGGDEWFEGLRPHLAAAREAA